jgi:glycine oxidase
LPNIKQEAGACEITHSGWVDCELLINSFAQWLKQKGALIEAGFLYEDLQLDNEVMEYHGMKFNNIIFCEGWLAVNNPFFNKENIIPCKGDILTIKYDNIASDRIIKKNGIYLIPAGDNIFKAGSTYQWNNNTIRPDEASKKLIEDQLDAMLENKYTTIDHKSAIRPTTQNREVIAKRHPEHKGMFMLNGLGARGILQGPWWAKHIVKLLGAIG